MKKLLTTLLVLAMVLTLLPAAALAADANTVTIEFLGTSDVHGQLYATDYTAGVAGSGTYRQSLTRVATYVKAQRAACKNVFLVDSGDLSQGTPLTYYYDFNKGDVDDPAMKTLRTMGYNMFVVGNHEFNYGMTILQRQLAYLTSAATATESQVNVCVANYLDSKTNSASSKDWATWNGYKPYQIYDYDGVKVAVIGLGNPNIANWDGPANREGIYFAGIQETYKHYEAEMKASADMIVVVAHCGVDAEFGDDAADSLTALVAATDSIDLVFSGHAHQAKTWELKNKSGKSVWCVQPGSKASNVSKAVAVYDKTAKTYTMTAESVPMTANKAASYEADAALTAMLKPYEDATWNDYMLQPIGKASANYSAANLGLAPSAFMDLINTVQLWGTYDNTGKNTPDDKSDDTQAQLSISAPLTSGSAANLIPAGNIMLGDLFKLYRYENWFYQITMSGKELHEWLEFAATKIKTDANGNPTVSTGDLTYYDVIMGDGFSYVIDPTQAEDSRVVSMTYKGAQVKDTDTFTVVVNNYRFTGGGNYVAWLNNHGCDMSNLTSRVIYYTRTDMIQGEDLGQARNLLAAYIRAKGTITPAVTSTWSLKNTTPFTDVKITDYFYGSVAALTKAGTIDGMTATTFVPAGTLTRGQFVTMLYRLAGKPAVTAAASFTDVTSADYFAAAVAWAVSAKITDGATDTTFAPGAYVTREQAVTFLYRYAQSQKKDVTAAKDLTAYTDYASLATYAKDAMSWAVGAGLVDGTSDTTLSPADTAVRAQAAALVYRFQSVVK